MPKIDKKKLRALLRRLTKTDLLLLVERAVDLALPSKLPTLLHGFANVDAIAPTMPAPKKLLAGVRTFHAATVKGDYYDGFEVNSKDFSQTSRGTQGWLEECQRNFEKCRAAADEGDPAQVREAFDLLFDLLSRLDRGEDIIVFADEGGSWQVEVDWRKTLPVYFRCLAQTSEPAEYTTAVLKVIEDHGSDRERPGFLRAARAAGTKEQKKALLLATKG